MRVVVSLARCALRFERQPARYLSESWKGDPLGRSIVGQQVAAMFIYSCEMKKDDNLLCRDGAQILLHAREMLSSA
jgi:hypothetical protein